MRAPVTTPTPRATEVAVAALAPWFHNLHLPDGTQTAPEHPMGDFPRIKWREVAGHIPCDLRGWRVLDVGCNAGFYSFRLAARGARVTAIDTDPHCLAQARWAARQFALEDRIEFRRMQVYDLAHLAQQFDLVWCMGGLCHVRHPLLVLDILRRRTRRLLMLQTSTMPGAAVFDSPPDTAVLQRDRLHAPDWPRMAFIERRAVGTPEHWWAPNVACVEAMLRSAGFCLHAHVDAGTWLCGTEPGSAPMGLIHAELRAATGGSVR